MVVYAVGFGFICFRSVAALLTAGFPKTDLALAAGEGDVNEAAGVLDALLGTSLWSLLLLLWLDL